MIRILAISGSLRDRSSNTSLLRRLASDPPPGFEVDLYEGVGALPHFNSDIEENAPPDIVLDLRRRLGTADALVICSPEYAHGVPGSLKNALDWLVGGAEMIDKNVVLINLAPWSTYAQASLRETITIMSAHVIADVPIDVKHWADEQVAAAVRSVFAIIGEASQRPG